MTVYDLISLLILAASAGLGYVRGGARELVTVVAFILAVVVAVLGLRITGPIARHAIHIGVLANGLAILVVFAMVYAGLRILGRRLIQRIPGAEAGSRADRLLGMGFGLVRGVVALGVLYMLFTVATPPERTPHWVKHAALYPLSQAAGRVLIALAPEGSAVAHKVVGAGPAAASDGPGYDDTSRKSVDDLVEKNR
jgi:membrane protein required for colicin V production